MMGTKLYYEDVYRYIESNNYKLLSKEYINSSSKLEVECPIGHTYKVSFSKFKIGRRCPHCSNRVKITEEEVISKLKSEGYALVSTFINSNENITVQCPNYHLWEVNYQKFKKGNRCSKCSNRYIKNKKNPTKWNTELVKRKLEEYNYELLSDYINSKTKIKIKCPKGHVSMKYFGHFIKGHLCRKCSVNPKNEEMRNNSAYEFKKLLNAEGYIQIDDYENSKTPILVRCKNNHYSKVTYDNYKKSNLCKGCLMSSYEKIVYDILIELNLKVIHEYVHQKLTSKRFDFAIMFDDLKTLKFLIEVDGQMHFVDSFGREGSHSITKIRDNEKNEFCKINNIELIRIPYFRIKDKNWIIDVLNKAHH